MPAGPKLRAKPLETPFEVALIEPEIPPNTGAVARTCAATQSRLRLVGKLGFQIDDKAVRRAGLDYWPLVDLHVHDAMRDFEVATDPARWVLFTANAERSYLDAPLDPGAVLIFGKESVGLDPEFVEAHRDRAYAIPTLGAVRSLNLSNAVAIVLYEALRRSRALEETFLG